MNDKLLVFPYLLLPDENRTNLVTRYVSGVKVGMLQCVITSHAKLIHDNITWRQNW